MMIQHIGTRALSLYITNQELTQMNFEPEQIGRQEARQILAHALEEKCLGSWEAAELTLYAGKDALLLFARRRSGKPVHFFFPDFEDLIQAAHLCPDPLPSGLSRVPGGYVLTVYPFEGETPPAVLREFGNQLGQGAYLAAHLTEQGAALLPTAALAQLREHFA
ncbi:MAG: hypothetical protein FWD99_08845 [Oscillospiraceae bacterium]|nr:hypothetical protein [Oscillospiraceae bacterium]